MPFPEGRQRRFPIASAPAAEADPRTGVVIGIDPAKSGGVAAGAGVTQHRNGAVRITCANHLCEMSKRGLTLEAVKCVEFDNAIGEGAAACILPLHKFTEDIPNTDAFELARVAYQDQPGIVGKCVENCAPCKRINHGTLVDEQDRTWEPVGSVVSTSSEGRAVCHKRAVFRDSAIECNARGSDESDRQCAVALTEDFMRSAALPVGAAIRMAEGRALCSMPVRGCQNVFPVPGPPLITVKRRSLTMRTACLCMSPGPASGNKAPSNASCADSSGREANAASLRAIVRSTSNNRRDCK